MSSTIISLEQLRENADTHKALVALDGSVYDISDFISTHPGGMDVIYPHLGTDISAVFRGKDGAQHTHSNAALEMLQPYCIGQLEGATNNTAHKTGAAASSTSSATTTSSSSSSSSLHLDMSKPLVWQVAKLGKHYNDYVHRPQHLPFSARFFENNVLELLSRTPWYVIPIVWWPIITLEYKYTTIFHGVDTMTAMIFFAIGVGLWTLMEYSLHRYLFHIAEDYVHLSPSTIRLHFLIHGCHHLMPMDRMRLVFPPAAAAIIMIFIYTAFHLTVGAALAPVMMGGATFGYTLYDLTHYYLHHGVCLTQHFRTMKSYHLAHHYKNPLLGFGISSKIWDYVMGTVLKH